MFPPVSGRGDYSVKLKGVGQKIHTSLSYCEIGGLCAGDIQVTKMTATSFSIKALPGHPEYPGTVTFSLGGTSAHPTLDVSSNYPRPAFGMTPDHYKWTTGILWSGFADGLNSAVGGLNIDE